MMPFYRVSGQMVHLKLGGKLAKNPPAPCCGRIGIDGIEHRCCAMSSHLCDWPLQSGGTCDAPLCADHAVEVGIDRHYCPRHHGLSKASKR